MTKVTAFLLAILLAGCVTQTVMQDAARNSLIIEHTVVWGHGEIPQSIAIIDGVIRFIGSSTDAARYAPGAKVIDATGTTTLPGLVDAHGHIDGLGTSLQTVDLSGTSSEREVGERIAAFASKLAPGEWATGRGWDQNDWEVKEFPTAATLDRFVADRPAAVQRIDGHALLANSAALRAAGITAATPDPEGGRLLRDAAGNPSGVFVDHAMALVDKVIPQPTFEQRVRRVRAALDDIASNGLTAVHDAGADRETVEVLRYLAARNELPVRVYVMLSDDDALLSEWFQRGPLINDHDRLTIRAVKLYADGALGSRGAAMLQPYSDDPGNSGLLLTTPEHIRSVAEKARKSGFQVCTHAIGDRAVRMVIDSYAAAGVTSADRFRIEHLQIAALNDFPRLGQLGIIASMQPTHATSDMPWAESRIGAERIRGAYAWRRVLDAKAPLAFGSDFPIEAVNPFFGIYSAVTRQDHDGKPGGGWYADQRLTLSEAVDGFTRGAAYAAFEEKSSGTIEKGRWGDLTIIEGTLAEPLYATKVRATIVGGAVAFQGK